MPAYFAEGVECTGPARDLPAFARLRPSTKWHACSSNQNGRRGTVVWMGRVEDPPTTECSGWVKCSDGLWYLPGLAMPPQTDLVREHRVDGIDYATSRGVTLTIPIASAAPRKLLFSTLSIGDPATDFATRCFALFERISKDEQIPVHELLGVIADAIGQVYFLTPEMLDEAGWITSADVDQIVCCLMGVSQKKAQPAGDTSPSPAGA